MWLQAVPMRPPTPKVAPPEPDFTELLENLAIEWQWLLPWIGIAVVLMVAWGVVRAWRSDDLDAEKRTELKRLLIDQLRQRPGGLSAEELQGVLGVSKFHLGQVAEEMRKQKVIEIYDVAGRGHVYHLAGVAGARTGTRK